MHVLENEVLLHLQPKTTIINCAGKVGKEYVSRKWEMSYRIWEVWVCVVGNGKRGFVLANGKHKKYFNRSFLLQKIKVLSEMDFWRGLI